MNRVLIINDASFGGTSEAELGSKMMGSFLRKMYAEPNKPDAILFYNSGVQLAAEGSAVLDALEALERAGVELILCGTCVGYFKLGDKIAVGRISNMPEVISLLMKADSTITV